LEEIKVLESLSKHLEFLENLKSQNESSKSHGIVTKKGGVHRTHSTPTVANEPCQLDSTDLLYFT
jgi:hypothetical protein